MVNPLILLHAFLAEIGLFAFLWIVVELLNPTESRIQRAQIAAVVGVCGLYLAWLFGGFYYVEVYGLHIKPLISASDAKWTHSIVMEVKEHIFLFLPILGTVILAFLLKFDSQLIENKDARVSVILMAGMVFLLGFALAGMGALISSGYRVALQAGQI
jgi:hypothetical protein